MVSLKDYSILGANIGGSREQYNDIRVLKFKGMSMHSHFHFSMTVYLSSKFLFSLKTSCNF